MITGTAPIQPGAHRPARRLPTLLLAAALADLALIALFWVGFIGSDDSIYWMDAGHWLDHAPYLGTDHWALRYPVVLPIALARAALGDGLPALLAPTILYGLATLLLLTAWTARAAGLRAAAFVALLLLANPQFILQSTTANVDLPEILCVLLGLALLDRGMATGGRLALFASGLAFGAGMLCRETTAFAIAAVLLLFLAGYGMSRARYLLVAAGGALVVGAECLAYALATGDPLYRYAIAATHDTTIDRSIDQGASIPLLHPLIDPVTMLLLNHNFGLVFWVGPILLLWLARRRLPAAAARLRTLLATTALAWLLLVAILWTSLPLIPRYDLLPSLLVSALSGLALATLHPTAPRRATLLLLLLVASGLAATALDNRNYLFGEHALVQAAATTTPALPIHTDPQTLRRATLLLQWAGTLANATAAPPDPGSLVLANPGHADPLTDPRPGWVPVATYPYPATPGRWLARLVFALPFIPPAIRTRLDHPAGDAVLYRLPA